MPTVTGQVTAAAFRPLARTAIGSVVALMLLAYQFQALPDRPSGSRIRLSTMPCTAGSTPVMRVVCAGKVTVGRTPTTPSAKTPSAASLRRFGTGALFEV